MLQDQVQTAKELLAKKPSPEFSEQLSASRQRRNEQQSKLESLLMAREIIISAIPMVIYCFWSEMCTLLAERFFLASSLACTLSFTCLVFRVPDLLT